MLAACLALGAIHAYMAVARYEPIPRDTGDSAQYLDMTEGKPLDQVLRVYRWRVLTPLIVRWMPGPPASLAAHYEVDAAKVSRFKYALWNTLGNVAAALALMLLMQALGFTAAQGAVGALLYSTSTQVMLDGAAVLVDPWANAAIAASLLFALRGQLVALGLAFTAGLFVKETLAVVPAFLFLLGQPRQTLLKQWAVMVPGVAVYAWFRYVLYPGGAGVAFSGDWIRGSLAVFLSLGRWLYVGAEFALNFALLAPLAWLGWKSSAAYPALRRWAWLLPALFVTPMALGTELTRPWFNGFPVFIPLAVLGVWRVLELKAAPAVRTKRR